MVFGSARFREEHPYYNLTRQMGQAIQSLLAFMQTMIQAGTISEGDLQYVCLTDDVAEAQAHIQLYVQHHFKVIRRRKPLWWLLERV